MGCWDTYCLACGFPCHSNKYIIEAAEETKDNNIIKQMRHIIKETNHFNNNIFLTVDDRTIQNCKEVSCNINFVSPSGEKLVIIGYGTSLDLGITPGIFIHTQCWKLIKDVYGINLKYSDLPIFYTHIIGKKYKKDDSPIDKINYGPITKYWGQYFDYVKLIQDKNIYMIDMSDDKNISRIKKIISQYKLKNDPKRIGPNISATFFNIGTIRLGNDKNFWEKKNNKWQQIKERSIQKEYTLKNPSKKILERLYAIPMIGESNTRPTFIKSMNWRKNNFEVKVVTLESHLDQIDKLII